jgi:AcrR family transcriptional regulator
VPKAGLNEVLVVNEAERLVDEVGLSRLTMAGVAERLGVRQPSLYKHVENLDDLRHSLALRAKTQLAAVIGRASVGRAGADAVISMSRAYRAFAHEHPGRYASAQRAPVPGDAADEAASAAVVEVVFDILAGFELRGDDAVDAARALRSALHGFVALEASGGFGLPVEIGESFERLIGALVVALASWPRRDSTPG